jgi:3-hydroxypropanoate dehydrogenase
MSDSLNDLAIQQLFTAAHTANKFADTPVGDDLLNRLYNLCKFGPTSMNCQPMRLVFVRSADAKSRLKDCLSPGNVDKTMAAPVTAIVAMDTSFFEFMPTQFPAMPAASQMFSSNAELAHATAFRNSSLQGAYLIMAARTLGLAAGPMSGFDPTKLNAEFFPDGRWKANLLINLGFADVTGNRPRGPRLTFEDVALVL